ncbi:MAG TPA: serine/threonine-protein kinase [Thermoanaerobaculia bacterium]|jgi:serine/threonine protein kinase
MRWLSNATVAHLRRVAEWPDLGATKYRLLGELGRGGMGTVYLAEDVMLERRVALKVVATSAPAPEAAARMLREARILAGLEHPGIVPVHDAGALPDGRVFYAMKRVDGQRLDALAPTLPLPERLRIFRRICEAVAFAHARGVIHRDLKPENVMVGPFGEVLVMDWGVAKILSEPPPATGEGAAASGGGAAARPGGGVATAEGTVVGTADYMAPEQAEGAVERTGPPADIFALGGVLAFLLRPEGAAPRPLSAAVRKARATLPEDRYASAGELAADVTRYLEGQRVLAHAEGPLERAGRVFTRYRAAILLILGYLLVRTLLILFAGHP